MSISKEGGSYDAYDMESNQQMSVTTLYWLANYSLEHEKIDLSD